MFSIALISYRLTVSCICPVYPFGRLSFVVCYLICMCRIAIEIKTLSIVAVLRRYNLRLFSLVFELCYTCVSDYIRQVNWLEFWYQLDVKLLYQLDVCLCSSSNTLIHWHELEIDLLAECLFEREFFRFRVILFLTCCEYVCIESQSKSPLKCKFSACTLLNYFPVVYLFNVYHTSVADNTALRSEQQH